MDDRFDRKLFQMAEKERLVLPETLKERTQVALGSLSPGRKIFRMNVRKTVILAAAMILLLSATATASVGMVRERMEAMNREKLEEYFVQIYTRKVPNDNYNRYFSDSEKLRMEELGEAYETKGRFPEGELTLIDQPEQYKGRNVSYYSETGTFFFPEKEMSDEQLLQIIDFRCKRDYSLQKMNEMIASGEAKMPEKALQKEEPETLTDLSVLKSDAIWDPAQELTVAYTGDLSITAMAAGGQYLYLGGWNAVHRMEIGGSSSEVFFEGFEKETMVTWLYVDQDENVYVAGAKMNTEKKVEGAGDEEPDYPARTCLIWKLDPEGNLLKEISLSEYEGEYGGWIGRMAVDGKGRIYLNSIMHNEIYVLDGNGEKITSVLPGDYQFHGLGGLCVGKDGKVYTWVLTRRSKSDVRKVGIASIDPEAGALENIYLGIAPGETILWEILAPGTDTDFVFWGVDGIFNYNLGEESAVHKTPAYEMPCELEGAKYCALRDGRIVLAARTEFYQETYGEGLKREMWKPQSTYFYYLSGMRG